MPYQYWVEGGCLFQVPEEQSAQALIRDLHASECSLRGIARELERRGYRTRRGLSERHSKTIRSLIAREAA